jgi:predicted acetyltransferase
VRPVDLRLLTDADADSSTLMSHHAFGVPTDGQVAFTLGPGVRRWGLFDGTTLAAKANDRNYDSMIGGRRVPTAGVAGVAVAPEYRGAGLARRLMTHLLSQARERGAVISTLFRTAPALYRSLGYEQVAVLMDASLPTSALRGIRPFQTTLRRAEIADAPEIRRVYAAIAVSGSCLLTRDGPSFDAADPELIGSFDGISLAVDRSGVVGYAGWHRGSGYGESAVLRVGELLALTGDGYRALLGAVGSFDAVTPTVKLRTSGEDPVHWVIPGAGWAVDEANPYMLRVIDLAGAIAARGWPPRVSADLILEVDDPVCPWNSGRHRLVVEEGAGMLETGPAQPELPRGTTVTPNGLAVLYAGGVQVAALRRAGLVSGGTEQSDVMLDAAFAGPRPAILDYF